MRLPSLLLAVTFGCGLWLAAPADAAAQRTHTVRSGQSMARIARRYRIQVWDLALANRMRPSRNLRPGQVLTVPPRTVTYVRPGQTLTQIASDHSVTVSELRRLNRLRRNRGLRVGQRLILPGHEAAAAANRDWGEPETPGTVTLRRHDETETVALVDGERRVTAEGLQALARLMRRHDDDEAELPHPRLASLLAAISDHFGGRAITIVSGRRPVGGYTRGTSRHVSGRATDIQVRGVPRRTVWNYCRSLANTGCGFYPRSTFVHVDVRDRHAQWVDWSGPGQRARYGNLRGPFPRRRRRRPARRRRGQEPVGRSITRPDEVPVEVALTDEARALIPADGPAADPDDPLDEELDGQDGPEGDEAGEALADGEPEPDDEEPEAVEPSEAVDGGDEAEPADGTSNAHRTDGSSGRSRT